MNSKFEIVVYWSEQDGHFLAEVPELPSIITDGATRVEALRNAEEMIDAYLKSAREASWPIPEPKGRKSSDNINGKIQRAEQMKVHTMFVIGKRDMEANAVSVRVHGKGNLGAKPRIEVVADILQSMKERRA